MHNDVSVNGVAAGLQLHGQLLILKRRVLRASLLNAGVGGLRGADVGVGVCVLAGPEGGRVLFQTGDNEGWCVCVRSGADERMINVHYYYY